MSTPETEERSRQANVQAYTARGFAFHQAIVPDFSARVFSTQMNRNMLHVACTCAMHALTPFITQ